MTRRGVENLGFAGIDLPQGGRRFRAATDATKDGGIVPENLKSALVEVRFADLKKDMPAVTALFNQPSAIEHLAGIAPAETPKDIDVRRYGIRNPNYGIVIATVEDMAQYFKTRIEGEKPTAFLLIAEDKELGIVGTVTVEKPAQGLTWGGVSKLVVLEKVRGRRMGTRLLQSANALIFSKLKDGGMELPGASAGIIEGVRGSDVPRRLFRSQGYAIGPESQYNCVSWDNETQRFAVRSAVRVTRGIQGNKVDPAFLPKETA